MSRLRNIANAGYVATPPAHFRRIAAQVAPLQSGGEPASPESWLLDPCAGAGQIGRALANRWHLRCAGVEINQDRGQWVRRRADHAVIGDAFETECGHGQFVVVFSNPPYDRDDKGKRLEWRFLQRFRDALVPGGLLIYVIPGYRMLEDEAIIPHLAQFYRDCRLFTLPEPNPYHQVILYAVRREARDTQARAAAEWLKTTLQFGPPPLPDTCSDPYTLPARPRASVYLRGKEMDVEQVRQEGLQGGLALDDYFRGGPELNTRIVMPLKKRHLAAVIAAGLLDNSRVGDDIIRGSVRRAEVEVESDDPTVKITRTVYYSRIVAFNPQTGAFRIMEEGSGLSDYMREHTKELIQLAQEKFRPMYEFDMRTLPERVRWILAHLSPGQPVPGKPAGLWPGQRHVLAGLYTAVQQGVKTLFLEAQMGWGKSRGGASFIALFHLDDPRKAGWFVTEAHLVDQMVGEIKSTLPAAFVFKVETLEDAIRFVRLGRHPDYANRVRIAVIGKQTLKDGSGWEPAVVRTRQRVADIPGDAAGKDQYPKGHRPARKGPGTPAGTRVATQYRCPDCYRLQVYRKGEQKGQIVTDDDAYFESKLRRCLHDIVQEEEHTEYKGCGSFLGQVSRRIGGSLGHRQEGGLGRVAPPAVTYRRDAQGHRVPQIPVRRREPVPGRTDVWQVVWYDAQGQRVPLPRPSRPGRVRMSVVEWLKRRGADQVGTVVFDECFPAGTPVATPAGPRPIENLQPGDAVLSYRDGQVVVRRVTRTIQRPLAGNLVRVTHAAGSFRCTSNHQIYAAGDYVRADALQPGQPLTQLVVDNGRRMPVCLGVCAGEDEGPAAVPGMRHCVPARDLRPRPAPAHLQPLVRRAAALAGRPGPAAATPAAAADLRRLRSGVLQHKLQEESALLRQVLCRQGPARGADPPGSRTDLGGDRPVCPERDRAAGSVRADENAQPDARGRGARAGGGGPAGPGLAGPGGAGWQWGPPDRVPVAPAPAHGLADGVSGTHREPPVACGRGRPGRAPTADRHRMRRAVAPDAPATEPRPNQGATAARTGLAGPALPQRGDPQRDGPGAGSHPGCRAVPCLAVEPVAGTAQTVYNLEVADTHCYFAAGILVSNCHGYKAEETNSGYALADMIGMADRALLMTGTMHGGYVSTLFYLAHRASADFRRRYGYRDVQRFVERHGFLEKKTVQDEDPDPDYGTTLMRARTRTYVKELPGTGPALIAEFLGYTVFTTLSDLGVSLPPVEHVIRAVSLDRTHGHEYQEYLERCKDAMKEAKEQEIHLAGSFLHTLQGYAVAPWRREELRDKDGGVWASAPNLELVCPECGQVECSDTGTPCPGRSQPRVLRGRLFANEEAMLAEIKAEKAKGRRVVVFVVYTGKKDVVTTRLLPMCKAHGLNAIFCDVDADERGQWIETHGQFCDVMFVNVIAAMTGLNLVHFQTAVFYQVPYSCYAFQQAPARLRRPTQTQPVRIVFLNEEGTIVEKALALMFQKLGAANAFRGESMEGALGEVASSGSFMDELVAAVLENGGTTTDLEALFARYCVEETEQDEFLKPYDLTAYDVVDVAATRRTVVEPLSGGRAWQPRML